MPAKRGDSLCGGRKGIVFKGREGALKCLRFPLLLDSGQTAVREEASPLFSDEQGNPLGELLFMETVRSWQERIAGKSPAEILNEWIHEMGMEK